MANFHHVPLFPTVLYTLMDVACLSKVGSFFTLFLFSFILSYQRCKCFVISMYLYVDFIRYNLFQLFSSYSDVVLLIFVLVPWR